MTYSAIFAAILGFVVGWLALDSFISGVILGATLGFVMFMWQRRKRTPRP